MKQKLTTSFFFLSIMFGLNAYSVGDAGELEGDLLISPTAVLTKAVDFTAILPEGLEVIGASAFENCASLELVSIPSSVTAIGAKAFHNTPSIEYYVVAWPTTPLVLANTSSPFDDYTPTLIVPAGTEAVYRAADVWANFIVDGGTTSIVESAESIQIYVEGDVLKIESGMNIEKIDVYSVAGQKVLSVSSLKDEGVSIAGLSSGAYIVCFVTESGEVVASKFVK